MKIEKVFFIFSENLQGVNYVLLYAAILFICNIFFK